MPKRDTVSGAWGELTGKSRLKRHFPGDPGVRQKCNRIAAPPGFVYRTCACGNAFFHVLLVDASRDFFGLECTGCHQVVDAEGYPMKTEAPRPLPEGKGKCTMWGLPVKA